MDRRTAAGVFVLALAALVVIAAWLLRAEGEPTTVVERSAVVPDAVVAPGRSTGAFPRPAAPLPSPLIAATETVAPVAPARSAAPASPPRETGDFLIDAARERVRQKDAAWRRAWGPKGRIVEAGSGTPIAWKSCMMQVRRPGDPSVVETRGIDRRTAPGVAMDGKPDRLCAFDLRGATPRRGGEALAEASAEELEYRVIVRAWGYIAATTPWQPLGDGPLGSDLTIALERDELGVLAATVRNEDGTPFRGSVVAALSDDEGHYPDIASGTTDAGGRVRLPGIPSGEFVVTLHARMPERPDACQFGALMMAPSRVVFPRGAVSEAQFVVPASGEIEISWRGPDGAPVKGLSVGLQWSGISIGTSSSAKRVVGIVPGPVKLSLVASGFLPWESEVEVVAGQVTRVEPRFEKGEDRK